MKTSDIAVATLKCTPGELEITWQNSSYSVYSSVWLRDNDPVNHDPLTGQRLVSLMTSRVPHNCRPRSRSRPATSL